MNGNSLQAGKIPEAFTDAWIVWVVEPCYVYVYVHIEVTLQEIQNFIAAPLTGAPGQVPGHVTETVVSWLEDFLQEVLFCMVLILFISDPVFPNPAAPAPLQLTQEVRLTWGLTGIKLLS